MDTHKLSFFASAIRPHLWEDLLKSLRGGKYEYEVIFAGHIDQSIVTDMFKDYPEFKYITTGEIKPAQCYEIARRACRGRLICWIADDCAFSEGFVDKVCDYYDSIESIYPIIISCKTNENCQNETMQNHRFFGRNQNTPLMAPIGIMSKEYCDYLGGIDKRYICGQYENDLVMEALSKSAKVYLYEDVCVNIDHSNKHGSNNNFWSGYNEDREQLENSWCKGGYQSAPQPLVVLTGKHSEPPYTYWPISNVEVLLNRNDKHEPYPDNISLIESCKPCGIWK